jgi:hypothetical protein
MSESRRFPPPWHVEEHNKAVFIVKDANGVSLAYCYYFEEGRRAAMPKFLSREEALKVANWIARSPGLRSAVPVGSP